MSLQVQVSNIVLHASFGIVSDEFDMFLVYLWVFWNCFAMQALILTAGTPLSRNKNPFVLNVLSWSLRFMNYSKDMQPRR